MSSDTQLHRGNVMPGIVRGISKHTMRPVVDGIINGIPRKAHPTLATPTQSAEHSATKMPQASFGSGVFGEGAARPGAAPKAEPEKKGRGRPKKRPETPPEKEAEVHGTTKGEMRKTARRAYEK